MRIVDHASSARKGRQQFADAVIAVEGVSERHLSVELVVVTAPFANPHEISRLLEFGDDSLGCTLCDLHAGRNITQPDRRILRQTHENVRVIREKSPMRHHPILGKCDLPVHKMISRKPIRVMVFVFCESDIGR